jgi:hypothetical protein
MTLFDGDTYDPSQDKDRLLTQLGRVQDVMFDGKWHTLPELVVLCGGSDASVSARIRDLRKQRFGSYSVGSKRIRAGLWAYRLVLPVEQIDEPQRFPFALKKVNAKDEEIARPALRVCHSKT